ncbi:hypothetical protein [uncultured Anaerofustis sp.]|uniref:hypothetical protein n=1 Tax=uncultured Anaerofustis sp. TaxID=904996 RepID=UPI0025CD29C6|nr:hypothetical protein [uncultured Anaerofustis sp.]
MDKKTEKKIASRIKYLIEEVDNIIKLKKDINLSSSEKEIKKLDKKVKGSFEMIQHYYNRVKTLDCTAFYMIEYAGFKWFYWKRNILLDDNEQHIELSYH